MLSKIHVRLVAITTMIGGLVSVASAQAYSTSTAASSVTTLVSDVSAVITQVVVVILALLAALLGLGWGVRKFKRYITGRKF